MRHSCAYIQSYMIQTDTQTLSDLEGLISQGSTPAVGNTFNLKMIYSRESTNNNMINNTMLNALGNMIKWI